MRLSSISSTPFAGIEIENRVAPIILDGVGWVKVYVIPKVVLTKRNFVVNGNHDRIPPCFPQKFCDHHYSKIARAQLLQSAEKLRISSDSADESDCRKKTANRIRDRLRFV